MKTVEPSRGGDGREVVREAISNFARNRTRAVYARSTFPLFHHDHLRPDPIGSCVLVRYRCEPLLLSAAHVLAGEAPIFLIGPNGTVQLAGKKVLNKLEPGQQRADDPEDIGIIVPSTATVESLPKDAWFQLTEDVEEPADQTHAHVVGFPHKDILRRGDEQQSLVSNAFLLTTREVDAAAYSRLGINHHAQVALDARTVAMTAPPRLISQLPLKTLEGISGGGLWSIEGDSASVHPAKLLGIINEIRIKEQLIVGTRMRQYIGAIKAIPADAGETRKRPPTSHWMLGGSRQ